METLRDIGAILSGVAAIASLVSAAVVLRMKLEVQELRTDLEKARREDREKLEAWVEDRYVRRRQAV